MWVLFPVALIVGWLIFGPIVASRPNEPWRPHGKPDDEHQRKE